MHRNRKLNSHQAIRRFNPRQHSANDGAFDNTAPQRPKPAAAPRRMFMGQFNPKCGPQPRGTCLPYTTAIDSKMGAREMDTRSTPNIVWVVQDPALRRTVVVRHTRESWDGTDRLSEAFEAAKRKGFLPAVNFALARRFSLSMMQLAVMPDGLAFAAVVTLAGSAPRQAEGNPVTDASRSKGNLECTIEFCALDRAIRWDIAELTADKSFDGPRYAHFDSDRMPRPTAVLCSSVGNAKAFVDPTGNVAWWKLTVDSADTEQVIAQLAVVFEDTSQWAVSDEAQLLLEDDNVYGLAVGFPELVLEWLDQNEVAGGESRLVATMEFLHLLGIDGPNDRQRKELTAVMREIVGEPVKSKGQNFWRVPVTRMP